MNDTIQKTKAKYQECAKRRVLQFKSDYNWQECGGYLRNRASCLWTRRIGLVTLTPRICLDVSKPSNVCSRFFFWWLLCRMSCEYIFYFTSFFFFFLLVTTNVLHARMPFLVNQRHRPQTFNVGDSIRLPTRTRFVLQITLASVCLGLSIKRHSSFPKKKNNFCSDLVSGNWIWSKSQKEN